MTVSVAVSGPTLSEAVWMGVGSIRVHWELDGMRVGVAMRFLVALALRGLLVLLRSIRSSVRNARSERARVKRWCNAGGLRNATRACDT